jgi:hypothetical protein
MTTTENNPQTIDIVVSNKAYAVEYVWVGSASADAPHIVIEPISLDGIRSARMSYETTVLKQRLAKFHNDVDSAFFGWNDMWLNPAFAVCDIH